MNGQKHARKHTEQSIFYLLKHTHFFNEKNWFYTLVTYVLNFVKDILFEPYRKLIQTSQLAASCSHNLIIQCMQIVVKDSFLK